MRSHQYVTGENETDLRTKRSSAWHASTSPSAGTSADARLSDVGSKRYVARKIPASLSRVRCVVGSILHEVNPLSYFSFQPVLHDWCKKGGGMCYPVCGMVHIKEPLLLTEKSSPCGGSGIPLSLSEWSSTICLTPYNRK